jgi:hypothetical protein
MAPTGEPDAVRREGPAGPPSPLRPTPALERIAVLLRHIDTQLATVKQEVSSDRRLSALENVPDLDHVLGPLEKALDAAAGTFGLEPVVLDGRRALRGALHILWADLIDMSPEKLRNHWGLADIPDEWPQLHQQLLAAVEEAIAQL